VPAAVDIANVKVPITSAADLLQQILAEDEDTAQRNRLVHFLGSLGPLAPSWKCGRPQSRTHLFDRQHTSPRMYVVTIVVNQCATSC
jgi:hypothetical protein